MSQEVPTIPGRDEYIDMVRRLAAMLDLQEHVSEDNDKAWADLMEGLGKIQESEFSRPYLGTWASARKLLESSGTPEKAKLGVALARAGLVPDPALVLTAIKVSGQKDELEIFTRLTEKELDRDQLMKLARYLELLHHLSQFA
jgi:hypothetical protein